MLHIPYVVHNNICAQRRENVTSGLILMHLHEPYCLIFQDLQSILS